MSSHILDNIDPLIRPLIPLFLKHQHQALAEIHDALAHQDFDTLRTIAHKLKGSGGSYGLEVVSLLGKQLEDAARAGDANAILSHISTLEDYLQQLV